MLAPLQTTLTCTMHALHLNMLLCIGSQLELRQKNREASLAAINKVGTSCYILAVAAVSLHHKLARAGMQAKEDSGDTHGAPADADSSKQPGVPPL